MTDRDDNKATSISLPAIERKDLRGVLDKYGLLDLFMQNNLQCASCGSVLDETNMGALVVRQGRLVPYCNASECIDKVMSERKK